MPQSLSLVVIHVMFRTKERRALLAALLDRALKEEL
jgi:hypothetical protein